MSEVVRLPLDEMVKRFEHIGARLAQTAYVAMLITANEMVRDVIKDRLAGPRGATGRLGIVTGTARRSMQGIAGILPDKVYALLGSGLGYVKAHEQGFDGPQHIRAHDRRRLGAILAVSIAQATRGNVVKRARQTAAQRRAGPIHVKAHDREANIIAKHFIRDTVREAAGPATQRTTRAILIAARTGRVPTPREVGV